MWNLVYYVISIFTFLAVYTFSRVPTTENGEESSKEKLKKKRNLYRHYRNTSIFNMFGLSVDESRHFQAFQDKFDSFDSVSKAISRAGLTSCNMVIGVDFTASNKWQGRRTFSSRCLHKVTGDKIFNPYQKVISIIGSTLESFDDDNLIPAFGFGDTTTTDQSVFTFKRDGTRCKGFQEVLDCYNSIAQRVVLSGPTTYAHVITKAIEIVKSTKTFHILVIIADGQVTEEEPTVDAIVEASKYPLSIIVVGVGDGPWDTMMEFDNSLPQRKFDNFQFVNFHKVTSKARHPEAAFALHALMEIPDQFKTVQVLGYLDSVPNQNNNTSHQTTTIPLQGTTVIKHQPTTASHRNFGGSPRKLQTTI